MKKFIGISLFLLFLSLSPAVSAQEEIKEGAKKAGRAVKKGGKKAGNKTAEVASKGKSKVVDQVYKDKVGANGETIYIDNRSKYYWVDKKGRKHYVTEAELKDKNG